MHRLRWIVRRLDRHPILSASLSATFVLGTIASLFADRQIVVNTSPSVAPGVYVKSSSAPVVGSIVDFRIPAAARDYVQLRTGCRGEDWYILKPVAAGPGDWVVSTGACLLINGRRMAAMPPERDAMGRPLPVWRTARRLGPDEFFVFSDRIPNSFDSRCYGPITRSQIAAVRRAWITW